MLIRLSPITTLPKPLKPDELMADSRQTAYLDAMDIDVWRLRNRGPVASCERQSIPGIRLGTGNGGVLFLCATAEDSSSRLANDIGRSLGGVPVWAWPLQDEDSVSLIDAVDEQLFTTVAIFGEELADVFFTGELPASLNSAKLVLLPSMQDILHSVDARRSLWQIFCSKGMVSEN